MPLYEFFCYDCRTTFGERRSFSQAGDAAECPQCLSQHTRKVIGAVAIISDGTRPTANPLAADAKTAQSASAGCGCGACSCGTG